MKPTVPIFIISYNRGEFLDSCVRSTRALERSGQIIICDYGSDDQVTLNILHRLESEGCIIERNKKINCADDLNLTNAIVRAYFETREATPYIVTDCDIDISIANANALEIYDELLKLYPDAECVGPMLRIRDIPASYPLINKVLNIHIDYFWHKRPDWIEVGNTRIATIQGPIDTTFALHRANAPFFRQKLGRRVYHPYEAKHLDWYHDEITFYATSFSKSSSPQISHWNNEHILRTQKPEPLRHDKFIYVDFDHDRNLVENVKMLPIPEQLHPTAPNAHPIAGHESTSTLSPGDRHYRAFVGPPKQFDFMGATQFRLLTTLGLRENHRVLDFGCGSLRAGRLLIPYLAPSNYFGLDPNRWLIEDGITSELGRDIIATKKPTFRYDDDFDASHFGTTFDFIVAQSIFSHAGRDIIARTLDSFRSTLALDGIILATFIQPHQLGDQPEFTGAGWIYPGCVTYQLGTVEKLIVQAGLTGRSIPWFHPRQTWFAIAHSSEHLPSDVDCSELSGRVIRGEPITA